MNAHVRPAGPAPADTEVDVSVIVVSWNVRELLMDCLRSVFDGLRMPADRLEVVLVDNASTDGSVEAVRAEFPHVRVIANEENVGFGKANNQALPGCRGRYLLLLNPDTVVMDGAIDGMLAHIDARPRVGALACRLLNTDGSFQRWTAGAFPSARRAAVHAFCLDRLLPAALRPRSMYLSEDLPHDAEMDWVSGACMMLRREAVGDRIFDEAYFMYGEDTDLCHRLGQGGWVVLYSPCATVVHHAGRSMSKQSGEILLTSFKGPRQFYRSRNGPWTVWAYDLMIASGFLVRTMAYAALAAGWRTGDGWSRAARSWSYARRAMLVMIGR